MSSTVSPWVCHSTVHFLTPDQQSGIHCLIVCRIKLFTLDNLGGIWRRICSQDIQSVRALEVLRNCVLQIDLLAYLLTVTVRKRVSKCLVSFILHLNNDSQEVNVLFERNVLHPLSNGMVTSHTCGNLAALTADVSVTRFCSQPEAAHTAAPVIFHASLFILPVLLLPTSFSHVCHLHDRSLVQEWCRGRKGDTRQRHSVTYTENTKGWKCCCQHPVGPL